MKYIKRLALLLILALIALPASADELAELKELADQGDAIAQYNLGLMYDIGEGVPQDYKKAHMWFNISAANGDESARKDRDLLAKEMTPEAVSQAQELASKWMESH